MNNNSVYIDSQKLTSAISDFRSVNTKIKNLFDKVDKEIIAFIPQQKYAITKLGYDSYLGIKKNEE